MPPRKTAKEAAEEPFGTESEPYAAEPDPGDAGQDAPADTAGRKEQVYADLPPAPFYVATRDLPVGVEMGGENLPPAAFRAGDRVPPEHVEKYGWAEHVQPPSEPEKSRE